MSIQFFLFSGNALFRWTLFLQISTKLLDLLRQIVANVFGPPTLILYFVLKLIPQDAFLRLRSLCHLFQLRCSRPFRIQQNQRFRERLRLSVFLPHQNLIALRKIEPLVTRMPVPPPATARTAECAIGANAKRVGESHTFYKNELRAKRSAFYRDE